MSRLAIRTYCSVTDPNYDECEALKALHSSISRALKIDEALSEEEDDQHIIYLPQQFTISIAGRSIAFYVGGPQLEGLYKFIEHIAGENLYDKEDYESED